MKHGALICTGVEAVQTALIQITGRFCETYASDLIITLAQLDAFVEDHDICTDTEDRWVIPVGIRDSGVDHESFILDRLNNNRTAYGYTHAESVYRKILAIVVEDEEDVVGVRRFFSLYDITHDCYRLDPEDEWHD